MSIEWIIIVMGASYAIIEAVQLIMLIHQTRRTADLLEQLVGDEEIAGKILKNGFVGMSKSIRADPEAQQAFGELVSWMGACAVNSAKQAVTPKLPKIKSLGDVFSMAFSMPGVQAAAEKKVAEIVGGAAESAVEKVTTGFV